MATYLQICQSVRAQAGISGEGPTNVTGQSGIYLDVVRWVDEAYNEIQTLHENWNFSYKAVEFTLQSGFSSFPALATDGVRQIAKDSFLIQFQLGDKERLRYIPWHVYKNAERFLIAETGKPEVVTEDPSGDLIFYPTPDDDYEIFYEGYARPDVMEASLDLPIFAAQYHDLIKLKALMKYAEYYNAQEVFTSAERNFKLLLPKMQFSELPRDNLITPSFVPFA